MYCRRSGDHHQRMPAYDIRVIVAQCISRIGARHVSDMADVTFFEGFCRMGFEPMYGSRLGTNSGFTIIIFLIFF